MKRQRAEDQREQAEQQRERAERLLYYSQIALAQREWEHNEIDHARLLLNDCRWDLRGREHAYLRRLLDSNHRTLHGHTGYVFGVAFSPDGERIVSGGEDNALKLWDAQTGQEVMTLKGHTGYVASVAFSPDGKRIVSGSADKGSLRLLTGLAAPERLNPGECLLADGLGDRWVTTNGGRHLLE
jgi:hypothetical protein